MIIRRIRIGMNILAQIECRRHKARRCSTVKMESVTVLLYTHKDYNDVLRIYIENYKKYWSHVPLSVCINDKSWLEETYKGIFNFQSIYQYDDSLPYAGRMTSVLQQIKTKYVLINQEINVIVDHPAQNLLETIVSFMEENSVDQVRLSDSGLRNIVRNGQMFQQMQGGFFMSVISAVWKTASVLALYTKFSSHSYRTIECDEVQHYVANNLLNFYVSSPLDVEHPPLHALSWHFPSIHVTHFGKWCVHSTMNRYYVMKLLDTYGIDFRVRGIFSH